MLNKLRKKDLFLQIITYLAAFMSLLTLLMIVFYVFSNGLELLNIDLIRNDYLSVNHIADTNELYDLGEHKPTIELKDSISYSSKWGLGLIDEKDLLGKNVVEVYYVHPDSPFINLIDKGNQDLTIALKKGSSIIRIAYDTQASSLSRYGAEQMIAELDLVDDFRELEFSTPGGGIRGSIITTFYLIGLTLVFALPIGIGSAVYLNEYAKRNKFTRTIRSLIETLTGVPSIIYGLMGLAVFVPFIVNITDATGGNIISGAMTLSVILLPVIIRTTEESLKVVPDDYRFASLALGANKTQTTFKVILPNAFPGILTATLLAIGRIIGESAALVFAIGTAIKDDISLTGQSTSLAVHIWSMMSDEPANIALSTTIALIILLIVLILNVSIKLISRNFMKRYGVKTR